MEEGGPALATIISALARIERESASRVCPVSGAGRTDRRARVARVSAGDQRTCAGAGAKLFVSFAGEAGARVTSAGLPADAIETFMAFFRHAYSVDRFMR